jgi:hypothetical protein
VCHHLDARRVSLKEEEEEGLLPAVGRQAIMVVTGGGAWYFTKEHTQALPDANTYCLHKYACISPPPSPAQPECRINICASLFCENNKLLHVC